MWFTADMKPKAKAGCRIDADVLMIRCLVNGEQFGIRPMTKETPSCKP